MYTTPSGLRYEDLEAGEGPVAEPGKRVFVRYTGRLEDGTEFDSSPERGDPYRFVLGAGEVIPGWEEGIRGMKPGGKRRLVIPPELAHGERGYGSLIPPNSTLTYEVEVLMVQGRK